MPHFHPTVSFLLMMYWTFRTRTVVDFGRNLGAVLCCAYLFSDRDPTFLYDLYFAWIGSNFDMGHHLENGSDNFRHRTFFSKYSVSMMVFF